MENPVPAPGWPGIAPTWTSSAKSGVGTSLGLNSRVWFSISHGILNEIYYPRVDRACTRDMGLIVTDEKGFFSEEKRHATSNTSTLADGVPAFRLVNTCNEGRYRIEKEIFSDPARDVVLQRTRFVPLKGKLGDYHLFILLSPHLNNHGSGNTAWVGDYKGVNMLFAERNGAALALACSLPWIQSSVGFAGSSDGWQDLWKHRKMEWRFSRAENGNVALTGEIDLQAGDGAFDLFLGFGNDGVEAGHRALASMQDGFDSAQAHYLQEWKEWQNSLLPIEPVTPDERDLYRVSAAVLKTHFAPNFPGAAIASLSIPWGFARGDNDLGGYHLVWPRDLVETAGGMLAAGAKQEAHRVLCYLQTTQEADGHWSQNMWIDGLPYWGGIQMDETALPILLVNLARRAGELSEQDIERLWPMVRRAATYLVCNGPVTQEDRWEEDPGYSPFTVAAEIAALVTAADLAETMGEHHAATYLLETADCWNASIERWMYVRDSDLARRLGVDGYYVRVGTIDRADAASPMHGFVPIKNRPPAESMEPADNIVSPDALALVRFGLRPADDPRILNTLKVIDTLLRAETPHGPAWYRYNDDGYGEHEDGSPFDGTGVGHLWPLLTGERAHYEIAAGRPEAAALLLRTLEAFASDGGLIPEQIWDRRDIPNRELFFGRPSGSAMPLVWAHAEYIKLRRSLRDGRVFDMPPQTAERYLKDKVDSPFGIWRFNHKVWQIAAGQVLRVEVLAKAVVRWSTDNWTNYEETTTSDTGLGVWLADLPTRKVPSGSTINFTFYWPDSGKWEGANFAVGVE